jgi:hypothetical protein
LVHLLVKTVGIVGILYAGMIFLNLTDVCWIVHIWIDGVL